MIEQLNVYCAKRLDMIVYREPVMDKKIDIMSAARALFTQFGLRKVTTDDIARKALVSKATIYKYYKNKYQIFDEIVKTDLDQAIDAINAAVDKEANSVDKLRAHLYTKIKKATQLTDFYEITQKTWPEFQPYLTATQDRFMEEEKEIIQKILEAGIINNELDVENVDLTTQVLAITLRSVEHPWALKGTNIGLAALSDMMLSIIINGVRRR